MNNLSRFKSSSIVVRRFFQKRFCERNAPRILLFICSVLIWIFWVGFPDNEVKTDYMRFIQDPEYSGAKECGSFPCFGNSMCKPLEDGLVKINSRSVKKYKSWRKLEGIFVDRNLPARFRNCSVLILESDKCGENMQTCKSEDIKQIGEAVGLQEFRETVCRGFSHKPKCNVEKKLEKWDLMKKIVKIPGHLPANLVRNMSPITQCASQRLVNRLVRRSITRNGYVNLNKIDETKVKSLLFKMKFASGVLIKEAFPAEENWPFGSSYGACGRIAVVSKPGIIPLTKMFLAPWKIRVDIALQLLQISQDLTENDQKYLFLMHELNLEDIEICIDGKVKIENTNNIIIVDKIEAAKNKNTEEVKKTYEVKHPFVFDNSIRNKLCFYPDTDINYYTVCRMIESGLLEHPREKQEITSEIIVLLNACIHGDAGELPESFGKISTSIRHTALLKLQTVLEYIRPCSPEVSYRYPECKWAPSAKDVYQAPWFEVL